jgi:hypothetical protein
VPDRSSFSKNRHGRFAEGDVLRSVFEMVVRRCVEAGLVGGTGALVPFRGLQANRCRAMDGSTVQADANRFRRAALQEIEEVWAGAMLEFG